MRKDDIFNDDRRNAEVCDPMVYVQGVEGREKYS
jgi:hypothetical protein